MDPLLEQLKQGLGGTYQIDRELGGGMSRVFVATEVALNRRVVLKVLPPELARDVSAERFKREISLAASLQHAHIVPLLTAGQVGGVPWFTMPFVDGQSLRARLAGGELPMPEAVRLLRDVASALVHAHARGVVHRDIKPENILLSDGSAFVTDFGVSKAVTEAGAERGATFTSIGVALGTPAYMAPEQIAAERNADHRADIYAFGVVAFEVLTGRNPFAGRSTQATMAAHMTETPPPVESQRAATPPALAALVNRCLAKSPADRPQRAQELVETLDSLTTPTGSTPYGTAPFGTTPATVHRGARWRVPVVAVVVLAFAGGAWAAWRARTPELATRRVAVIPFTNLTGDTTLAVVGRIAAEELSRSIAQTDSADVVASTAIEAALGASGGASADAVNRVARSTQASIVVIGSYSKSRDSLRMQVSIVDARNGKVIRALDPTTGPVTDPMVAISALRERLLGSIVSGDAARRVALGSPPPKYSAYLEYMEGSRMFMRNQAASRAYFERAIALDSTFVSAYGMLSTTYTNASRFDDAERVVDRLEALRDRLSSYDRLTLELLRAHNRYVADEILPRAQEVYARGGDPTMSYLVGFWALRILKPKVALAALQAADSAMTAIGWVGQARDIAIAHHQLGDYRAELAALDRGTQALPQFTANYKRTRLRAYAGLRDSAAALALADTLLRAEGNPNQMATITSVHGAAREFEAHGDSLTGDRLHRMELRWLHEHPTSAPSPARINETGFAWFDVGNDDSAAVHLGRIARDSGNAAVTAVGYLGIIAARRGDTTRAVFVADSLGRQTRKWDLGLSQFWEAAIQGQLGRRERAMQLLVQARQRGQSMAGWHAHTALRALRGYAPFETMIKPSTETSVR